MNCQTTLSFFRWLYQKCFPTRVPRLCTGYPLSVVIRGIQKMLFLRMDVYLYALRSLPRRSNWNNKRSNISIVSMSSIQPEDKRAKINNAKACCNSFSNFSHIYMLFQILVLFKDFNVSINKEIFNFIMQVFKIIYDKNQISTQFKFRLIKRK